jgi:hypothetical protein
VTRSCPTGIGRGYLLDGTPVAEEPQNEQTDTSGFLRSLSGFCLCFMTTSYVVVPSAVATAVVGPMPWHAMKLMRGVTM